MNKAISALFRGRTRTSITCVLIVMLAVVFVWVGIMFSRAKATAERLRAYGRLSQMRLACQLHEENFGKLPPLYLRDNLGNPTLSWRALILTNLNPKISMRLNLSQPWNSDHNRRAVDRIPPGDWVWFAKDRSEMKSPVSTHIVAYLGRESIWDAGTGLPKETMTEHSDAILLIWVPTGTFHPLQPGDITEKEVRERIENGEEVLFIAAGDGGRYDIVTIERGELVFRGREGRK